MAELAQPAIAITEEQRQRLRFRRAVAKKKRIEREQEGEISELNLTAMMDMMTIILVFLLKTFATTTLSVTFDGNMKVPSSFSQLSPREAVNVTVSRSVVLVEGEAVAPINAGKVDPTLKRDGENGYYITPLVAVLEKYARKERRVAELMGQEWDQQLMVVADQNTPYRLLTEILYSCGQAGYQNYRLLVLKKKE
jgi:biopolymer transport protein ExbD